MTSKASDPDPELELFHSPTISPPPYDQHENGKLPSLNMPLKNPRK